jgi:hypothetical protein
MAGSPVGANNLALQRFHGLAPATLGDWTEAVAELVSESEALREERAAQARAAVENHYSFGAWQHEWLEAVGIRERHHQS